MLIICKFKEVFIQVIQTVHIAELFISGMRSYSPFVIGFNYFIHKRGDNMDVSFEDILKIRRNKYQLDCLISSAQIVPFIGAGMSCTFYPNWRDFLLQFDLLPNEKEQVESMVFSGAFEEAASYVFSISQRIFNDTVKDVFSSRHIYESGFSKAQLLLPSITIQLIWMKSLNISGDIKDFASMQLSHLTARINLILLL